MGQTLGNVDLAALCEGDKVAWDAFVPAAAAVIRAVAWRVLSSSGNERDIPDVVQEVFVRLSRDNFRLLRDYDVRRASLSTWLGVISTGTAIDWLRRKQPKETALDEVPEEQLGFSELSSPRKLTLPTDMLTPRQTLILTLLYEHDLSPEEVAGILRIEAQTVRSQRHKAITRLRELWREQVE